MGCCVKNCFLIAAAKKECELKKLGLNLSILKFTDKGESVELIITRKGKEQKFVISFRGDYVYLENLEYQVGMGRPVFHFNDMATYLFVLANGGQVLGKLMYPGVEEKKFLKSPVVIPT